MASPCSRRIGEHVRLDRALEQIVGRLHGVQRRNARETRPSAPGKKLLTPMARILPALSRSLMRAGGFLDRRVRVRPMHLIEIDQSVRSRRSESSISLTDARAAARCGTRLLVLPIEPDFGGDNGRLRRPPSARALPTISSDRPKP